MSNEAWYVDLPVLWPARYSYGYSTNPQATVIHRVAPGHAFVRYFPRRVDVPVAERMILHVYWVCGQRPSSRWLPTVFDDAEFSRLIFSRARLACRWCTQLSKTGEMVHPRTKKTIPQPVAP